MSDPKRWPAMAVACNYAYGAFLQTYFLDRSAPS